MALSVELEKFELEKKIDIHIFVFPKNFIITMEHQLMQTTKENVIRPR